MRHDIWPELVAGVVYKKVYSRSADVFVVINIGIALVSDKFIL